MSLSPGTRLGPYEVTAEIGAGSMGEVYKARDTRLDARIQVVCVGCLRSFQTGSFTPSCPHCGGHTIEEQTE